MPKIKVFEEMEKEDKEREEVKEIEKAQQPPQVEVNLSEKIKCKVFRLDGRNDQINATLQGIPFRFMPGEVVELPQCIIDLLEEPHSEWVSYEDANKMRKMKEVTKFRFAVRLEK